MKEDTLHCIDRRTAIKWMFTAAAAMAASPHMGWGSVPVIAPVFTTGYGTDPELNKSYNPGDFWPLTMNEGQRRIAAALCDVIIPADATSPSASSVGVHDFVDEWVSAPYPPNVADRPVILEGLNWIEAESQRRFGIPFVNTIARQKRAICDDICYQPEVKEEFKEAARFFAKFRDLTAGGYFTTPEGMKAVGYIGNVPLASFDGPPADLIKKLGLA